MCKRVSAFFCKVCIVKTRMYQLGVAVHITLGRFTMQKKTLVVRTLALGAVAAPVIVYLHVFGTRLSSDHTRWAEFGSAIGGIYAPLIAMFTLAVLLKQVMLQAHMNTHESDQAYLQQAREDIEFYSTQLVQVMNGVALPGKTLRTVLHDSFEPSSVKQLDSQQLQQLAANIHATIPPAPDIWSAIYPILMGLAAGKTYMYQMTLGSSTQKLTALLSFETCVALDNFHRARTGGRAGVSYVFSPLLREPSVHESSA